MYIFAHLGEIPIETTGTFPNWKQLSGTLNLGKNLHLIHKGCATCQSHYAQCKGGISCGKGISILGNLSMADISMSQPLNNHRFHTDVRAAITQRGHAKDKLAPINNKLMENFLPKIQVTKFSFDSQRLLQLNSGELHRQLSGKHWEDEDAQP